jgi:NAD(P)-dependent dehydrogenase (short-subunit alcohol dehydrogenase family)
MLSRGSRGLGLHTATAFLRAGARKVFICARKADGPQGIGQAVNMLNALGCEGHAVGFPANVAEERGILELLRKVKATESKLDILVANAGAVSDGRSSNGALTHANKDMGWSV